MIDFEKVLMELFVESASHWVAPSEAKDQALTIKCWQGKRIYVNIKYHNASFSLYVDITIYKVYIQPAKNSSTRNGLELCSEFIKENINQFVERYRD
jgi:hypothetical protein